MKTFLASILLVLATAVQASDAPRNLVVHEWGTFTSVQGGNGVPLPWQTTVIGDLPNFVYNWYKPGAERQTTSGLMFGKGGVRGLQRMETPVIYFYSDSELRADVEVGFPKGLITEWYPQADQIGPCGLRSNAAPALAKHGTRESLVRWRNVRVLPVNPNLAAAPALALDTNGTHYFAARETDAAILSTDNLSPIARAEEREKLLFYRGTGSFPTPLIVTTTEAGVVSTRNVGKTPLTHLFLLQVQDGKGAWSQLDLLNAKSQHSWPQQKSAAADQFLPLTEFQQRLSEAMANALTAEGLFPAEARAMVKTWSNAWFAEEGVRVLYILPRAWTDEILPMKLDPKPRELVRVMVGRAEIIPPQLQMAIAHQMKLANAGDQPAKDRLQAYWRRLGRFAGPAAQLANELIKAGENKPIAAAAWY